MSEYLGLVYEPADLVLLIIYYTHAMTKKLFRSLKFVVHSSSYDKKKINIIRKENTF